MQEQMMLHGKEIAVDVLQVIHKNLGPVDEYIVAVNATDLIFLPGIAADLRTRISTTYPDLKTIYYRVSVDSNSHKQFTPVMADDGNADLPQINVSPENLKRYELTLQSLKLNARMQ